MDDEVEILEPNSASATMFASQSSNPRHWEPEGGTARRKSLNPSQGMDLICNCEDSKLTAYLKSAVERKDFAIVLKTLRGRELRFRRSEESMEEEVKTLKRELDAVRESEGKKFSKLMEECEGLKVELRERESELQDLKKRYENLSECYRKEISEGLKKNRSTELEDNNVKEIVPRCENPYGGEADAGMRTPLVEISTPRCLEKRVVTGDECCRVKRALDFDNEDNTETQGRKQDGMSTPLVEFCSPRCLEEKVETEKECCRVKRTLDFDNEDNTETQGKKQDGIDDTFDLPSHASDLPFCSANRVSSPHLSSNFVSNGVSPDVFEVDGLGNNEIEVKSLHGQSGPMAIMEKIEDGLVISADLGASCHTSEDKLPKDGLQCSIPARKINMEGGVAVGTALRNDVVILSDSESESSGSSLRKKRLSPCIKKATCSPEKQNFEVDIQSRVKIEGVLDDGGKDPDQNERQPLGRGAKRRCHMTVSSGSESEDSDVGFSCKRMKPRSGNLQTQVICEAECLKDRRDAASQNGQCKTFPKGLKEDAALGAPHETYECSVPDRNMGKEESLSCEKVEDMPYMKLKRIRKTKDVNILLTVELCDEHTDEDQGEASPGARFRSLKRVIKGNQLPNTGQLDEGMCPDKRAPVIKYKRLKRGGGEAEGPEKANVGNDVIDGTICNDNGVCESSIGVNTFTSKSKSDGVSKVAEGPPDSPIYTPNNRMLRSHSRKMINLTKESDGEDEEENDSQIDDLGDFIVDSSESQKDSECADENKSDSDNSSNNLDSSSEDDLDEVIRKLSRQRETNLEWKYEAEMLAAFAKDDVLCMRAVCALNRQQTNDERLEKASLYLNRRGFDKLHASRASLLAEFLTDNDPSGPMKNTLRELQKHDSKGAQYCRDLAIRHSKQLFEIYRNNEDPHFPHR